MKYDRRLQIRLDSNLHQQANDLYEKMGMDLATAIRLFLQQSVVQGGLPFGMMAPEAFEQKCQADASRAFLISQGRAYEVAKTAQTCRLASIEMATLEWVGDSDHDADEK